MARELRNSETDEPDHGQNHDYHRTLERMTTEEFDDLLADGGEQ